MTQTNSGATVHSYWGHLYLVTRGKEGGSHFCGGDVAKGRVLAEEIQHDTENSSVNTKPEFGLALQSGWLRVQPLTQALFVQMSIPSFGNDWVACLLPCLSSLC